MTALSTFDLYRQLAVDRPIKARRYAQSITETLERTTIHDLERARLEEALEGIAAGFAEHPVCQRCYRHLTDPESISRHEGPACHAKAMAAAS